MNNSNFEEVYEIMNKNFEKDILLSLVTNYGKLSFVRIVDAFFENGCFYVITYATLNKMKQISRPPRKPKKSA